ncbi:hypothetical protein [Enterovibrio sp. 27052020O]|uniref:hypothetical protein n=1 Tax=Enterovibrio sp. 27052020O TaxID=3241166 RepID=UPI003890926A
MKNSRNPLRRLVDVLFIIVFLCAGYWLADRFLFANTEETSDRAPDCTLSTSPCVFSSATASLVSDTVAPLNPTTLNVTVTDADAPYLLLELEGVEMNMGIYKLKLTRTQANQYRGDVMLPICMDAEMTWRGAISSPEKDILLPVDIRMMR